MGTARSYLNQLLLYIASGFIVVGVFNLLVDPYDLFRILVITGFNQEKFMENPPTRMIRAYQSMQLKPDAIILGSSRAGVGLQTSNPYWLTDVDNPQNFSLPGASIKELNLYLRHSHAISPLRLVVIGLDFFMFNALKPVNPDFDAGRLVDVTGHLPTFTMLKDMGTVLFSLDATRNSINVVLRQNNEFLSQEKKLHRTKGQRFMFELLERSYLNLTWFPCPQRAFSLSDPQSGYSTMNEFRSLISFAQNQNIDLRLFISPIHARLLESLHAAGLWPLFEQWKRQLLIVLEEDAVRHPEGQRYRLWDFAAYNELTTETVPEQDDNQSRMIWFVDSAHYSIDFGTKILDVILSDNGENTRVGGQRLAQGSMESWLSSIRSGHKRYTQDFPGEVNFIKGLAEKMHNWRATQPCQ